MNKNNYIDKQSLLDDIIIFQHQAREADALGKPRPKIPESIGRAILSIAEGIASRPNFRNYTYIEEMKGDGIVDCTRAVMSFNPEKSKNPFGYFSQVVWYAFLGRIEFEKKLQKAKIGSMFDPNQETMTTMEGDDTNYGDSKGEILDFYYGNKL